MKTCTGITLCLAMLIPSMVSAITVPGNDDHVSLNDGVYADGTSTANIATEILSMRNETASNDISISSVPYFDIAGSRYFQFIYDSNESSDTGISIDDIVISVNSGALEIWNYDNSTFGSILLNYSSPFTSSPQNPGGDMALYIPVALFNDAGQTGSDMLRLTVTQSDSHNGDDKWGVTSGGAFFGPDEPVIDPVPVPAALWLFGSGLLGLIGIARRKNTQ